MDENVKVEDLAQNVPFITFESVQARNERIIHRLITVVILLIISLVISNGAWLYYQLQYDYDNSTSTTTETDTVNVDSDGNGVANYIGNDGEITNGTSDSNENTNNNDTPENENTQQ